MGMESAGSCGGVAKVLEFQLEHHSFQRYPRAETCISNILIYLSRTQKNKIYFGSLSKFNYEANVYTLMKIKKKN